MTLEFKSYIKKKRVILLVSLSVFIVIIGFFSILNRAQWMEPYIGLELTTDQSGFIYLHPEPGGPAAKAGIQENDSLIQMEGMCFFSDGSAKKIHWVLNNRFQIITSLMYKGKIYETWVEQINDVREIRKIIYEPCDNMAIMLLIHRENKPLQEIQFPLEKAHPKHQFEYFFFVFVAFLTLIIGLFVLVARKPGFSGRNLFFLFTLNAFILLVYSYTTEDAPFAQVIFDFDTISRIIFAPLFLHFLVTVIGLKKSKRTVLTLIYLPPTILLILELGIHYFDQIFNPSRDFLTKLNKEFIQLQRIELITLGVYITITAIVLLVTYLKTPSEILKKQLKLILIGTITAFFPLILIYLPIYIRGESTPLVTILTGMPLIMLPLSLGYATIRRKLMDIEIQLLRALTYAIALTIIMIIYITSIILIIVLFPSFETEALVILLALVTLLLAIIYEPLNNRIGKFIDKVLYRESYDFRLTLNQFSQELSAEHNLRQLLYNIVSRLFVTFTVSKVSAFVYNERKRTYGHFISYPQKDDTQKRLLRKRKFKKEKKEFSKVFSDHIILRKWTKNIIPFEEMQQIKEEFYADGELLDNYGGDYLLPLSYGNKVPAIITLSRKTNGELLTTEDLELLDIIRLPAAIACENANLIEDVIEKNRKNEELSQFNSSILESMRGSVAVIDKSKKIKQVNSHFCHLIGLDGNKIINKNLSNILPADIADKLIPHLRLKDADNDNSFNIYKLQYNDDGRKKFLNIAITPLIREQFHNEYVLVIEDVSEQVMIEEQLIQSDKLVSLGMLAAGMAHEVNTPLAGISSYVQMLLKKAKSDKNTHEHEILKKIEKQTTRIKNLVGRLLNFTRPKETTYSIISINDLVKDTYELIGKQLEKTGIKFVLKLNEGLRSVFGDASRLQQVLTNLLMNAKDAIKGEGYIKLKTYNENNSVVISIEDDGIGISEDNLRRVYDPFFTTKSKSGGTGLGLSISYAIIREHLGTISIKSRLNEGTTFIIRLPIIK